MNELNEAVLKSYKLYKRHGPRSNQKLLPIHKWFSEAIYKRLGNDFMLILLVSAAKKKILSKANAIKKE